MAVPNPPLGLSTTPPEPWDLNKFESLLPLPFRLSILVVLGIWLWGLNLHGLYLVKVDVPALIRYPARSSHTQAPHHLSVYRLAAVLSIPLAGFLPLFWFFTWGSTQKVLDWSILPNLYLLILLLVLILPIQPLSRNGRFRLWTTCRRISIGGLARPEDSRFGDVLLADALTSYAKPLSEVYVTICMLVRGRSTTDHPDRHCGGPYVVPILLTVPFLIRFRQCLIAHQGKNAVKYLSALPTIAFSVMFSEAAVGPGRERLFWCWIVAATVNALYSFWWDVKMDWGLPFLPSSLANPTCSHGFRRGRLFGPPQLYSGVIFIDLLLRWTWSLKLAVPMEAYTGIEGGIFVLELLEVFRRWMWAFLRIEYESMVVGMAGNSSLPLVNVNAERVDAQD